MRLPAVVGRDEEDAEDDPTQSRFKWENGLFNGASAKMD